MIYIKIEPIVYIYIYIYIKVHECIKYIFLKRYKHVGKYIDKKKKKPLTSIHNLVLSSHTSKKRQICTQKFNIYT